MSGTMTLNVVPLERSQNINDPTLFVLFLFSIAG